jgi:stearoyl-CoA desaturase (delta-9 desaturase)
MEGAAMIAVRRAKPATILFVALIHLGALAAVIPWLFSWSGLVLFLVMVWLTASLGVSLGFHRLLSHRSYKARPWLKHTLVLIACLSLEMGPVSWSATHRLHHRETDHEDDPHSPLVNFLWAHIGWLFRSHPVLDDEQRVQRLVPDLLREPYLVFLERWYYVPWIVFAVLSMIIGYIFGGVQLALSLLVWGTLLRTVYVWHITWFVNSVTHLFGYRNYNTPDDSRNLWWVALVTFGEGWHNNHHAVAGGANFGRKWWELDPTYATLKMFQWLGWVTSVNTTAQLKAYSPVVELNAKPTAISKALRSLLRKNQQ